MLLSSFKKHSISSLSTGVLPMPLFFSPAALQVGFFVVVGVCFTTASLFELAAGSQNLRWAGVGCGSTGFRQWGIFCPDPEVSLSLVTSHSARFVCEAKPLKYKLRPSGEFRFKHYLNRKRKSLLVKVRFLPPWQSGNQMESFWYFGGNGG